MYFKNNNIFFIVDVFIEKGIIAEKSSVPNYIAYALNIRVRKDGYFEGEDYIITRAFGDLLRLFHLLN